MAFRFCIIHQIGYSFRSSPDRVFCLLPDGSNWRRFFRRSNRNCSCRKSGQGSAGGSGFPWHQTVPGRSGQSNTVWILPVSYPGAWASAPAGRTGRWPGDKKKRPVYMDEIPEDESQNYEPTGNLEESIVIKQLVNSLPPELSEVIILRFYQDLKYQDIAKILKIFLRVDIEISFHSLVEAGTMFRTEPYSSPLYTIFFFCQ